VNTRTHDQLTRKSAPRSGNCRLGSNHDEEKISQLTRSANVHPAIVRSQGADVHPAIVVLRTCTLRYVHPVIVRSQGASVHPAIVVLRYVHPAIRAPCDSGSANVYPIGTRRYTGYTFADTGYTFAIVIVRVGLASVAHTETLKHCQKVNDAGINC
jgi:hypothetical protein